jgi:chorismate synthase
MGANTFGKFFTITTFGESHGQAIGVVIDGVPPKIPLSASDIHFDLKRRRPGQSHMTTARKEEDEPQILSGVFEGKTTGTPLCILIPNADSRSKDYSAIKDVFRPGHADFTFLKKYGIRDYRGGGRSSGRETAARVAAGAVAKKILRQHQISVIAFTRAVADVYAQKVDYSVIEKNPVRSPDMTAAQAMMEKIDAARQDKDSVGGIIEAVIHGCPVGLGEPVFDKLDALLAHALVSIGGVKGIEFGAGFQAARMKGSAHNDKFYLDGDRVRSTSNHAGGILGGISSGEDIRLRLAVKPTSSIGQPQNTVTTNGQDTTIAIEGRHDPCLCPRMVPVVEAMIALTLVDRLFAQQVIRSGRCSASE